MAKQLIPQKGQTWYLKDPSNQINPKKYPVKILGIKESDQETNKLRVTYSIGIWKTLKSYTHPVEEFIELYQWID